MQQPLDNPEDAPLKPQIKIEWLHIPLLNAQVCDTPPIKQS